MKKKFLLFLLAILTSTNMFSINGFNSDCKVKIGNLYYFLYRNDRIAEVAPEDGYGLSNYVGLKTATIPSTITYNDTIYNVIWISGGTFVGSTDLSSVTIPNSVTHIGEEAFSRCTKLKSVRIPDGVTHIYSNTFLGSGITSITIPIQIDSIGSCAFNKCDSLSSVIWNAKKAGIWEIDYYGRCVSSNTLFDNCPMLSSLTVGEEVDSLPYFWGGYYFKSDSLKSVNWNAKNCRLPGRNLGGYSLPSNIDKITFGNKVEYIPGNLCLSSNIKTLVIPNSVKVIGSMAFAGCESLTSVILGSGITKLEDDEMSRFGVFSGSDKITSVTCYATNPPTIKESFNKNTIVYVPAASVNAYKSAKYWNSRTILPIGATPIETDDIHITPSENYADIIWKAITNAASYELVIEFLGNTWRFVFDADGILTSIANHAPARYDAPQGTQSAGFSYTVMGLTRGTTYNVTITAKAANGSTLNTETASFTTTGEPQGIEDVNVNNTLSKKIIRDGNVYILRGEKVFTLQGQEVK